MSAVEAQDLSKNTTTNSSDGSGDNSKTELGAKLVYGLLTLLILWAAGDANGEIFWSRQP